MDFFSYFAIGFIAQLTGSTLGMGYGTISSGILIFSGLPPVVVSATVNSASSVTSFFSSWAHWRAGNVDKKALWSLALPGILGACIGATVASCGLKSVSESFVGAYSICFALFIIYRVCVPSVSWRKFAPFRIVPLGFVGGALAGMMGGGWGPVVNSYLVATGHSPRHSVGTSNVARLFVTVAASVILIPTLHSSTSSAILGLIGGGLLATPLSAVLCRRMQPRVLMVAMSALLIFLGLASSMRKHPAAADAAAVKQLANLNESVANY